MTEPLDRAAIKALRESLDIAASMTYSGGGYRYCEVDPDELAQAIDALADLDEAERRIAAVEEAKHTRWVCEVYESGYHNGARCNADDPHIGRWNCGERFYYDNREIVAALHPVAEASESDT